MRIQNKRSTNIGELVQETDNYFVVMVNGQRRSWVKGNCEVLPEPESLPLPFETSDKDMSHNSDENKPDAPEKTLPVGYDQYSPYHAQAAAMPELHLVTKGKYEKGKGKTGDLFLEARHNPSGDSG